MLMMQKKKNNVAENGPRLAKLHQLPMRNSYITRQKNVDRDKPRGNSCVPFGHKTILTSTSA